jgi:hypothetical protein
LTFGKGKKTESLPATQPVVKSKSDETVKAEAKKVKKSSKTAEEDKSKEASAEKKTVSKVNKEKKVITKAKKVDKEDKQTAMYVTTETVKTEAIKTEAAKTEAKQIELVKTEAVKTEAVKTEAVKTKAVKTEAVKSEAVKVATTTTKSKTVVTSSVSQLAVADSSTLKSRSTSDMDKALGSSRLQAQTVQNGSASFEDLKLNFTKCDLKAKDPQVPLLISSRVVNCTPRPFSRVLLPEPTIFPPGDNCYYNMCTV